MGYLNQYIPALWRWVGWGHIACSLPPPCSHQRQHSLSSGHTGCMTTASSQVCSICKMQDMRIKNITEAWDIQTKLCYSISALYSTKFVRCLRFRHCWWWALLDLPLAVKIGFPGPHWTRHESLRYGRVHNLAAVPPVPAHLVHSLLLQALWSQVSLWRDLGFTPAHRHGLQYSLRQIPESKSAPDPWYVRDIRWVLEYGRALIFPYRVRPSRDGPPGRVALPHMTPVLTAACWSSPI